MVPDSWKDCIMKQDTQTALRVFEKFPKIPHITLAKAQFLYELIRSNDISDCLELGFSHGKSSAVIAQALEEKGSGHLTTLDFPSAFKHRPGINDVLSELGLAERVTVRADPEGFHWTLLDMLEAKPRPLFDFVFLDGAHTWAGTGFAFLLVERLLRPGAWVVFDDVFWTIEGNEARRIAKGFAPLPEYSGLTERERKTHQVRKVFDLLVSKRRYDNREIPERRAFRSRAAQAARLIGRGRVRVRRSAARTPIRRSSSGSAGLSPALSSRSRRRGRPPGPRSHGARWPE